MYTRRQFIGLCTSSLLAASGLTYTYSPSPAKAANKIPVLLYHRVGYTQDPLTVTPERFSNDLRLLRDNGYRSISLTQFQNFLQGQSGSIPNKPVLITFDDGYVDNFDSAFPLLQLHGMTASFFIISSLLWTDGRLSPAQINEMAQAGMSFGSHTVSHRKLADLSPSEMQEELNSSRSTLESVTGQWITAIAYPRGSYNDATLSSAVDNGYTEGFTTMNGACSTNSRRLELRRIPVFRYDGNVITVMNNLQ